MTTEQRPPRDNLVRAFAGGVSLEDDGKTLFGRIAPANQWAEIDSAIEGHFMERNAPGAFKKTFAESAPKIEFQHGKDPQLGHQLIAEPREFGEDEVGGFYRGELLDGLPPLIVDGLKRGLYGSSHQFSVIRENYVARPEKSGHNPNGIPERTVIEARVYELGPVTWPAYAGASAGVRSLTDDYVRDALGESDLMGELPIFHLTSITEPTWTSPALTPPAPSEPDAGDAPHLEPERRDLSPEQTQENIVEPKEYPTREEKVARVNELRSSLKAIDEDATGELEPAVQARWDAESREIDQHERDIRAIDERANRLTALGEKPENTDPEIHAPTFAVRKSESDIFDIRALQSGSRSREEYQAKVRDNALRAVEITRWPNVRADQNEAAGRIGEFIEYRDHAVGNGADDSLAERMLLIGSPAYRNAFMAYLRSGGLERGTALAVGVDATGGFSVPVAFDPTVIAIGAWTAINPYRAVCRQVTISGTDTWQALTATAVPAVYALEAAAATEQGPTFARPEFIVKRAHSFVTASYEMAQDRPDLAAELSVLFAEGKDTNEETQFTIGVGTTAFPQGAGLKDAYTRVDSVTNDVVAVADVRAVEAALPIRHRMNAVWFLSRAAIRAIQAFETTGGQLFNGVNYAAVGNPQSNAGGNTGLTLLGYPVYENPSMPWTPTTDDTTWGLLFNPQTYVIVDRVGFSVKVIPDMLNGATPSFPTGEIGIYAFWRNTARVLNVDGGRQGAVL